MDGCADCALHKGTRLMVIGAKEAFFVGSTKVPNVHYYFPINEVTLKDLNS